MASDKVKLTIHSSKAPENHVSSAKSKHVARHSRSTIQDKLLRNSCFACALLLGILALGNIQQPWAKNASGAIEKALTMEIDLDKSLGQLSFVQKLMPESALVFFNLKAESELMPPAQGQLSHSFSQTQPWLMFECAAKTSVCAANDGVVAAVSPMSDGGYGVLIDHGGGLESVTACLDKVDVQAGASIVKGSIIGTTEKDLYFELRQNGESIDPTEKMGL